MNHTNQKPNAQASIYMEPNLQLLRRSDRPAKFPCTRRMNKLTFKPPYMEYNSQILEKFVQSRMESASTISYQTPASNNEMLNYMP